MTSERCGPRGTWQAAVLRPSGAWAFLALTPRLPPWAALCRPFGAGAEAVFAEFEVVSVWVPACFASAVVLPCFASVVVVEPLGCAVAGRPRRPSPHELLESCLAS